jgi:plastocyanin
MKTTTFIFLMLLTASVLKAQSNHKVQQSGFTFDPSTLTIDAGEDVEFEGSASHPVLEVSESTWNADGTTPLEGGFSLASGSGIVNFPTAGTHYYVCTAHVASNGMKGKIIVQESTTLNEISFSDEYTIFPLPLTGNSELTVGFKSIDQKLVSIEIFDLAGNLRISSPLATIEDKLQVNCSELPPGLFVIKIKADDAFYYAKIIKE